MESNGPLDALPLWGVFIAILLVVLVSVECGYRLGKHRRNRHEAEKETPVGAMVGATLGLLAFILAFTFGLAAARFDTRRQVLLDEANAIGTTYLRACMLPDRRDGIEPLLREYVDTRLEALRSCNIAGGSASIGKHSKPIVGARDRCRGEKPEFDCRWSVHPVA
jgi:hypothetical protein